MNKSQWLGIAGAVIFLSAIQAVSAKEYSIKSVDFEVLLEQDGGATVRESRTYDFDGSFSWADIKIPLAANCKIIAPPCRPYRIKILGMSDNIRSYSLGGGKPGSFTESVSANQWHLKWYYSANNETKTFNITYKIDNAITDHKDIREFYWKLVGDEWDKGDTSRHT